MEYPKKQHLGDRDQGSRGNRENTEQAPDKPLTLADLATHVKSDYFRDNIYGELLRLNDSKRIDEVFAEIQRFTDQVASNLSVSQLRNVYGQIIITKNYQGLKMLRPNLAYIAARQDRNEDGKKVMAIIDDLIKQVNDEPAFTSFKKFMESLVAYHKFYSKIK